MVDERNGEKTCTVISVLVFVFLPFFRHRLTLFYIIFAASYLFNFVHKAMSSRFFYVIRLRTLHWRAVLAKLKKQHMNMMHVIRLRIFFSSSLYAHWLYIVKSFQYIWQTADLNSMICKITIFKHSVFFSIADYCFVWVLMFLFAHWPEVYALPSHRLITVLSLLFKVCFVAISFTRFRHQYWKIKVFQFYFANVCICNVM